MFKKKWPWKEAVSFIYDSPSLVFGRGWWERVEERMLEAARYLLSLHMETISICFQKLLQSIAKPSPWSLWKVYPFVAPVLGRVELACLVENMKAYKIGSTEEAKEWYQIKMCLVEGKETNLIYSGLNKWEFIFLT